MRYLYLSHTSFEYDGLPPELAKLTKLVEFDASYSLFFGPIDGSIFEELKELQYLDLSGLSFHHEIPTQLGNLPNIRSLYMEYSDVRGNLDFLKTANWPAIYEFWVDKNPSLTGTIPSEIGRNKGDGSQLTPCFIGFLLCLSMNLTTFSFSVCICLIF